MTAPEPTTAADLREYQREALFEMLAYIQDAYEGKQYPTMHDLERWIAREYPAVEAK